jgi:hypothetical protein
MDTCLTGGVNEADTVNPITVKLYEGNHNQHENHSGYGPRSLGDSSTDSSTSSTGNAETISSGSVGASTESVFGTCYCIR